MDGRKEFFCRPMAFLIFLMLPSLRLSWKGFSFSLVWVGNWCLGCQSRSGWTTKFGRGDFFNIAWFFLFLLFKGKHGKMGGGMQLCLACFFDRIQGILESSFFEFFVVCGVLIGGVFAAAARVPSCVFSSLFSFLVSSVCVWVRSGNLVVLSL